MYKVPNATLLSLVFFGTGCFTNNNDHMFTTTTTAQPGPGDSGEEGDTTGSGAAQDGTGGTGSLSGSGVISGTEDTTEGMTGSSTGTTDDSTTSGLTCVEPMVGDGGIIWMDDRIVSGCFSADATPFGCDTCQDWCDLYSAGDCLYAEWTLDGQCHSGLWQTIDLCTVPLADEPLADAEGFIMRCVCAIP